MIRFVATRFLHVIPVLLVSSIVVFLLLRLLPGDPAQVLAGADATPDVVAAIRHDLGLDRSLPVQYGTWITRALHLDLGTSVFSHQPVSDLIGRRLPASIELALVSLVLTLIIALPLGIFAALRRGRIVDLIFNVYQGTMIAIPNFWLGILAILLVSVYLGWLPPGGYVPFTTDPVANIKSIILPAITLGVPTAASLVGIVRASVLEVLGRDYVRTAHAKGVPELKVVLAHIMRNAMGPIVTMLGITFGRLLGSSVVVEAVFSWPGIGSLLIDSVGNRDYAVVQGTLLVFVFTIVLINLLTDIAQAMIDPRVRLGASK